MESWLTTSGRRQMEKQPMEAGGQSANGGQMGPADIDSPKG